MEANHELMTALQTLLELGKYSDLTIKCGSKTWAVHRALICSRSGFFDGACSHRFREAQTGIVELKDDDADIVEHMIDYFYKLDYLSAANNGLSANQNALVTSPTAIKFNNTGERKPLNLAFVEDPLLATAAAYTALSPALSSISEDTIVSQNNEPMSYISSPINSPGPYMLDFSANTKFNHITNIESALDHVEDGQNTALNIEEVDLRSPYLVIHAKVYAMAEKYQITGLKALARRKFAIQVTHHYSGTEFAESMQEVYESTIDLDRGLRDIVIQTFRKHPELARRKDIEDVVKVTPTLAWELFRVGWGLPIV